MVFFYLSCTLCLHRLQTKMLLLSFKNFIRILQPSIKIGKEYFKRNKYVISVYQRCTNFQQRRQILYPPDYTKITYILIVIKYLFSHTKHTIGNHWNKLVSYQRIYLVILVSVGWQCHLCLMLRKLNLIKKRVKTKSIKCIFHHNAYIFKYKWFSLTLTRFIYFRCLHGKLYTEINDKKSCDFTLSQSYKRLDITSIDMPVSVMM